MDEQCATKTVATKNLYSDLQESISELRGEDESVVESRTIIERALHNGRTSYGLNTGFGVIVRQKIGDQDLKQLQRNLI